jgi:hypothetical protein
VSIVVDAASNTKETMTRRKTCTKHQAFHVDVNAMLGLAATRTHEE